jgi:uncharacterized protein (TIGR03435 family)
LKETVSDAFLVGQSRHTVIDQTGLTGAYDIGVEWTPDEPNGTAPKRPEREGSALASRKPFSDFVPQSYI